MQKVRRVLSRAIDYWMTSIMMVTMSMGMRMKGLGRNVWMTWGMIEVGENLCKRI